MATFTLHNNINRMPPAHILLIIRSSLSTISKPTPTSRNGISIATPAPARQGTVQTPPVITSTITTTPTTTIYIETLPASSSSSSTTEPTDTTTDTTDTAPWPTFIGTSIPKTPSGWGLWPSISSTDTSTAFPSPPTATNDDPKLVSQPGRGGALPFPAVIGIVVAGIVVLLGVVLVMFWLCWRWRQGVERRNPGGGEVGENGNPGEVESRCLGWPSAWHRSRKPDTESTGQVYPGESTVSTNPSTSHGSLALSSTWGAERIHMPGYIDPSLYTLATRCYAEQNHKHNSKKSRTAAGASSSHASEISFPIHLARSMQLVHGGPARIGSSGRVVHAPPLNRVKPPLTAVVRKIRSRSKRAEVEIEWDNHGYESQYCRTAASLVPTGIGTNTENNVSLFVGGYRSRATDTAQGGDFRGIGHPSEIHTYSEYSKHRRRVQQDREDMDRLPVHNRSSLESQGNSTTNQDLNSNFSSLVTSTNCSGSYTTSPVTTASCRCSQRSTASLGIDRESRASLSRVSLEVGRPGESLERLQLTTVLRAPASTLIPTVPPLAVVKRPPRPTTLPSSPKDGRPTWPWPVAHNVKMNKADLCSRVYPFGESPSGEPSHYLTSQISAPAAAVSEASGSETHWHQSDSNALEIQTPNSLSVPTSMSAVHAKLTRPDSMYSASIYTDYLSDYNPYTKDSEEDTDDNGSIYDAYGA